tara:strand:+ start:2135 stop:3064 length:930 start_codon:yes stop_codon:yes gene_type:complete
MSKKIVFMGTPSFAVPILKNIYQNGFDISAVYTQPPKKSNRGQKLNKSPIHLFAETLNLEVRVPKNLKDNREEIEFLKKLNIDLVIVVAYGQIIPSNYFELSKNNFINIHASILPKWRGAAPIQRSIMNSDTETGISIMKINNKLDQGDILDVYKLQIVKNENSQSLADRLSELASVKICEVIDKIFDGKVNYRSQDNSKATYAKKIEKSESKINWNEKAKKVLAKINGLYPHPGSYFVFNGERYKILKAEISNSLGEPGFVQNDKLEICCREGSLKILEIQRQGRNIQKIDEFVLGSSIKKGIKLNNV